MATIRLNFPVEGMHETLADIGPQLQCERGNDFETRGEKGHEEATDILAATDRK